MGYICINSTQAIFQKYPADEGSRLISQIKEDYEHAEIFKKDGKAKLPFVSIGRIVFLCLER